jgi:hypothetical protein
VPPRNSTSTKREERPISKRKPLWVPNGHHHRGLGVTVGDDHKVPLMTREKPFFHKITNPQTANHTPCSRNPVRRRAHGPNSLSGPSSSQPQHPLSESPPCSRARHRTTNLRLARGLHAPRVSLRIVRGLRAPRASLRLARRLRGFVTPTPHSPDRSIKCFYKP